LQGPPCAGRARPAAVGPRPRGGSPVPERRPRPVRLGRPCPARAPGVTAGRCAPRQGVLRWQPRWPGRAAARLRRRPAHRTLAAPLGGVADRNQADGRTAMIPAARRRLMVLYVVVAALLISLGGRLWYLQVMTGGSYANAAARDQTRAVIVPSVRGGILDDVGQPLINNKTSLVVSVNRALVAQQPDGGLAELHRLAKLLHMDYGLLQQRLRLCTRGVSQPCWPGSPYQPIPVDQQASDAVALQIMESQREFPGVTAQVQPVINYHQ